MLCGDRFPCSLASRGFRLAGETYCRGPAGRDDLPDRRLLRLWPDATLARRTSISSLTMLGSRRCLAGYIKTDYLNKKPINTGQKARTAVFWPITLCEKQATFGEKYATDCEKQVTYCRK